jgi:hypothetical protein
LEYHEIMRSFAEALGDNLVSVAIAGSGWAAKRGAFPKHWEIVAPRQGPAYCEFLRSARIALAPLNREVVIRGRAQPGDEDTIRTYELAAAYCFFLHQRTDYVATVYDERSEVPLWSDATDLASLVRRWLPDEPGRRRWRQGLMREQARVLFQQRAGRIRSLSRTCSKTEMVRRRA